MASRKAVQVARAAMSGRLPPSCWPTIVETARPMPIIGTQATLLTLKASMVAGLVDLSQPADQRDEERERSAFDEPLHAARRAVGPEPPHEVAARPPGGEPGGSGDSEEAS